MKMTVNVCVKCFIVYHIGNSMVPSLRAVCWKLFLFYDTKRLKIDYLHYSIIAAGWVLLMLIYYICLNYQIRKREKFGSVYNNLSMPGVTYRDLGCIIRKLDYSVGVLIFMSCMRMKIIGRFYLIIMVTYFKPYKINYIWKFHYYFAMPPLRIPMFINY